MRGIFLRHDEQLGLSHEDFILFYVLAVLHPELPVHIRDIYKEKLGTKRIIDFRADILGESEIFLQSRAKDRLIIYTDGGDQDAEDGGIAFDSAENTKVLILDYLHIIDISFSYIIFNSQILCYFRIWIIQVYITRRSLKENFNM